MGSNAFGGSASQAPTTQPKEVPHYTFGPEDIEESYSAASPVNDSGWDSPGSYPPEPEAYESGVSRKKNKGKNTTHHHVYHGLGWGLDVICWGLSAAILTVILVGLAAPWRYFGPVVVPTYQAPVPAAPPPASP